MTISVNCEACGKVYSFKNEAAGQTFICQECGNDCVVPGGNQPGVVPVPGETQPGKALAIVSLVLSIISVPIGLFGLVACFGAVLIPYFLPLCCAPFMSSPLALAGVITGSIGLKKVKAGTASGKGLAMGGMITGIAVIVLNIILLVVYILMFGWAAYTLQTLSVEYNNY
jgi:hypothetical protein